jgi:glucan 1,3-beta-glucosidase
MLFLVLFLASLCCAQHIQYRIRSGEVPARGVNLGGWLVVEHWMTGSSAIWNSVPSNIRDQGEFKVMQYLGHGRGDALFEEHRANWITENDFKELASFRLNTVRVPVGYWIIGKDDHDPGRQQSWRVYSPGALKYLDRVIQWGNAYNVAVLVDIHAAKGSQNGQEHSAPENPGNEYWSTYPENVNNTLAVADFLARRYKNEPSFLGLDLINEPSGSTDINVLKHYFERAHDMIRPYTNCVLVHPPLLYQQDPWQGGWAQFTPPPRYSNFWHEWHNYLVWGYENLNDDQAIAEARGGLTNKIRQWSGNWLFNGEWSLATGPNAPFHDENKFRTFANAYLQALSGCHSGWTYWTWRTSWDEQPGRNPWSMRQMLRRGYLRI